MLSDLIMRQYPTGILMTYPNSGPGVAFTAASTAAALYTPANRLTAQSSGATANPQTMIIMALTVTSQAGTNSYFQIGTGTTTFTQRHPDLYYVAGMSNYYNVDGAGGNGLMPLVFEAVITGQTLSAGAGTSTVYALLTVWEF